MNNQNERLVNSVIEVTNNYKFLEDFHGYNLLPSFKREVYTTAFLNGLINFSLKKDLRILNQEIESLIQNEITFFNLLKLRVKNLIYSLINGLKSKSRIDVLIVLHHKKQVDYLKSLKLEDKLSIKFGIRTIYERKALGLKENEVIYLTSKPLRGITKNKIIFYLHNFCNSLKEACLVYKPEIVLTIEGDAPYQTLLPAAASSLGINSICLQWGTNSGPDARIMVSDLLFDEILTWSDFFSEVIKRYTPSASCTPVGHPLLLFCNQPINEIHNYLFTLQGVNEFITEEGQNEMLDLITKLSEIFPKKVYIKEHPAYPLGQSLKEKLLQNGFVVDPNMSLYKALKEYNISVLVGNYSSSIVEALGCKIIPFCFNIPILKDLNTYNPSNIDTRLCTTDKMEALDFLMKLSTDSDLSYEISQKVALKSKEIFPIIGNKALYELKKRLTALVESKSAL